MDLLILIYLKLIVIYFWPTNFKLNKKKFFSFYSLSDRVKQSSEMCL